MRYEQAENPTEKCGGSKSKWKMRDIVKNTDHG